jgi:hypothetical protein
MLELRGVLTYRNSRKPICYDFVEAMRGHRTIMLSARNLVEMADAIVVRLPS